MTVELSITATDLGSLIHGVFDNIVIARAGGTEYWLHRMSHKPKGPVRKVVWLGLPPDVVDELIAKRVVDWSPYERPEERYVITVVPG